MNPDNSLTSDKFPEDVASSAVTSRSGTERIKLFVFETLSNYASFFSHYDFTDRSGETWEATGGTPNIYSSLWKTNPGDSNPFSEAALKEVTIHEVGHAFDHLIGQSSQSGGSNYDVYIQRDFLNLDYLVVGATQGTSTPRPPCVASGVTPAPFANVRDKAGDYICHDGSGGAGTTLKTAYSGLSNHAILQHANVGQYWFTKHNTLWNELYAQALAYVAFADPNGTFAFNVPDNVFENSHFACTLNWATRVKDGHNTPSAGSGGSGCSAPVPNWYSF